MLLTKKEGNCAKTIPRPPTKVGVITVMNRSLVSILCDVMYCRELLWTLSDAELNLLEKSLCSTDDVDRSSAVLAELSGLPPELLLTCDAQPFSEFYADDLSDTDDAAVSRGLMVHSESTMTVVARPAAAAADDAAVTSSAVTSPSAVLTDSEARRLQHSKSWPQSADARRTAENTSSDGGTTSAVAVYGNQRFNFNLPTNTSTEQLFTDSHAAAAAASERFADHSIIYLSSPTSSVSDEQQIAYITDELCRIFCTDTASLEDDDDEDIKILSSDAGAGKLPTINELEVSASVQQQRLEGIACDCESSVVSDVVASADYSLSKSVVEDVTTASSVSNSVRSTEQMSEERGYDEVRSSFMDSPSSTEDESSSTLNTADNLSPPTISELSADILMAGDDVEPVLSPSPSELLCLEMPASSADNLTGVSSEPLTNDVMTCANDSEEVQLAAEHVAIASLEESCTDADTVTVAATVSATSCHVTDSDVKSTASSSTHDSLHHDDAKCLSVTPVIETEAGKVDGAKYHSSSQGWNCASDAAANNNGELNRDHERCVESIIHLIRLLFLSAITTHSLSSVRSY